MCSGVFPTLFRRAAPPSPDVSSAALTQQGVRIKQREGARESEQAFSALCISDVFLNGVIWLIGSFNNSKEIKVQQSVTLGSEVTQANDLFVK